MVNNLSCVGFYNILVAQTGLNNQAVDDPSYITVIQADKASIKFGLKFKAHKMAESTLHLIVIGDDHMKVAESCAKFKRMDIDILVASEYRSYKRIFGSLEEFDYNLPACIKLDTLYSSMIFLGTQAQAENFKLYEKLNIGACINLSGNSQISMPASVKALTINIADLPGSDLFSYLEKTTEFIKSSINEIAGSNIFIFCKMGISRSSTVLLAFIIAQYKISLLEAVDRVKSCRDIIRPNMGFLRQLNNWEREKLGKASDLDELPASLR